MRSRFSKPFAFIVIAILLMAMLASCTSNQSQLGPEEAPTAAPGATIISDVTPPPTQTPVTPLPPKEASNLWKRIQEKGEMVIGVSTDYPPFSYYNADGQLDGFDIALMQDLGQKLGVDIVFQNMPLDRLLDKVQTGEVDAAIGAIAITPKRQEIVAFASPYLLGDVALLANADADLPEIKTAADLADLKVGAEKGTDFADWLLAEVEDGAISQENVNLYPSINQTMAALVDGSLDVVIVDSFTAEDLARQTLGKLQLLGRRGKPILTYKPLVDKPLQGVEWVLSAYADKDGAQTPALTGVAVTAQISNAVINGNAGCNSYASDLQINESSLTITAPVTTRKQCAEPAGVMAQENQFLDDLIHSVAYRIEGDTLVFMDKEGANLLIFNARPQIDLANITWNLYAYGDLLHPQPAPENVPITLAVDKDGGVSGSSGCNAYSGKASVDGDAVSFELGAATLKSCGSVADAMESTYLGALSGVERAEMNQDQLILTYNGGLDALKFRAQHNNPLQFTAWDLLYFGDPAKENYPLHTTQLTALFGKDKLGGSAGCNDFNTSYSVKGDAIKIGKIALTRMLCPNEKVNKQEATYVKNLEHAAKYRFIGVSVAASGLYQQPYAIAVPQGADDLLAQLNDALAQLDQDQTLTALAQRYLPVQPIAGGETIGAPQPTCIDKLKWVADLSYDDHNMHAPPIVQPGAAFQKAWRLKNAGTCTWTTDYYLDFDHGNKPGADMKGGRTYIQKDVKPGETYDLALDLVAPAHPGVYQGFWNLYNADKRPFAQLWVGIHVPKPATPFPTPTVAPTATPSPIVQFTADHTHIQAGSCTTLYWNTQNASQVYLFEEGEEWQGKEVPQKGSKQVCPTQTTTYNLGVVFDNGNRDVSTLTIQVSAIAPPKIVSFTSSPPNAVTVGEALTLSWDVQGDVQQVSVLANDVPLNSNAPAYGSMVDYPGQTGAVKYSLLARGPGGASQVDMIIQVTAVQPTVAPTETPAPPTETPAPPTETPAPPTETPAPPTETPAPTPVPPGQDIINIQWQLATMAQAKTAPVPILPGSQITLFFDPHGAYNGSAGCNTYTGAYTIGLDSALMLMPGQVTQMLCNDPAGVMEQEATYLQALQNAVAYQIGEGGSLNVYTNDKWTLTFSPGPTPK